MTVAVLGGAAVAMTVRPSDSSDASSPLCRDTSRRFFPVGFSFLSFFFLLPDCLSRFPCRYPRFFGFSVSVVPLSLSVGFSLFRFLSPFAAVLSSFFLAPLWLVFIGAGGAGSTLPCPIIAHAWCTRRLFCHGAGCGGQWRRCLRSTAARASHHEMGGV